jgi:carbonic anhydrase
MRSILLLLASISATTACLYPRAEASTPSWSYDGHNGQALWHKLSEENKICATGKYQSPIDIDSSSIRLSPIAKLNYPSRGDFNLTNNGHTVEGTPEDEYTATLGGEKYKLVNFHFHASSEHRVDGLGYPLEVHFVHSNVKSGALAVVGVFFEVDSKQGASFFYKMPFRELQDKNNTVEVKELDLRYVALSILDYTLIHPGLSPTALKTCTRTPDHSRHRHAQKRSAGLFRKRRSPSRRNSLSSSTRLWVSILGLRKERLAGRMCCGLGVLFRIN